MYGRGPLVVRRFCKECTERSISYENALLNFGSVINLTSRGKGGALGELRKKSFTSWNAWGGGGGELERLGGGGGGSWNAWGGGGELPPPPPPPQDRTLTGHLLAGTGCSLGGTGHPLAGTGHPFAGTGHPLAGTGHPLGIPLPGLGTNWVLPCLDRAPTGSSRVLPDA